MPHDTPKGYACDLCGEIFYYESDCCEHEVECQKEKDDDFERRISMMEKKIDAIEKRIIELEKK